MEDFYDSIFEYSRLRTYFRCYNGSEVWYGVLFVDCFRYHFAGAVHDYLSGMLSIRHEGESLPEIIGRYLGLPTKQLMRGFTVVLMILVGAVFVAGPAGLLAKLTPEYMDVTFGLLLCFSIICWLHCCR